MISMKPRHDRYNYVVFTDTLLVWGMYITYIEEALKYISVTQLQIINLDSYSAEEHQHAEKVR